MKKKKESAVLMHIFFSLLIIIGVTVMYNNNHYGEGIRWISRETYEDTPGFSRQLKSDVDDIFSYVKYKEVFETDGKLDYTKPVAQVTEGPGREKTYTIDEMIRRAKSLGYYLNENFKVSGGKPAVTGDGSQVKVNYRTYEPDFKETEPGDNLLTLDQLAYEVLTHLGNYYSFYYHFIQHSSNLKFQIRYENTAEDYKLYNNISGKTIDDFKAMGKYLYVTGEDLYVDSNLVDLPKNVSSQLEQMNPYDNGNYYMVVAVNTSYPFDDAYSRASDSYSQTRILFIAGMASLFIGLLGFAVTLYHLVSFTGGALNRVDRLPAEICLLFFGAAAIFALFLAYELGYRIIHLFLSDANWYYGEKALRIVICYAACLAAALSLLKQYRAKILWSRSLTRRMFSSLSLYFRNLRFTARIIFTYCLFLGFNTAMISAFIYLLFSYDSLESRFLMGAAAILALCLDLRVFHQMYINAWETDEINKALLSMSQGNTSYKINAARFKGKEKELAEHINNIGTGLETALQEKVRSERLKADLITNVSHDIKTPLTSIINYVDLIKREKIQNPKIQGYLDVLEQKSQRLKTLTEDLVEASKASSGNLKLEIASIDFVELIQQTNGEFEEKFALHHLELVPSIPDESILIEADGRYLWRVLENLYNNAFKYAMEHSRVYVDIEKEEGYVSFIMKNISANPLNIRADELTERFVRGDVARTTEGSGLGISIAKSLTELQGGDFSLYIDGDLFKAQVAFPIKK